MNFKALKYCLVFLFAVFGHTPSFAMDAECNYTPNAEITKLRPPQFGASPNAWEIIYAKDGMDVFSDIAVIGSKSIIAVGTYTKNKEDKIYHPLIVKYNDLLKPVWDVREDTKEQRTIHRILKTKDGFTVLGDISDSKSGHGVYISSYTDDGKVKGKPIPIYESGGNLDSKAFILAQDGGGYIVVAQYTDVKNSEKQHGILYKISNAGDVVWKRSYQTGNSNILNNIQATLDGTYLASGQVVFDETKSAGWLLRLDQKGVLQWQKTYPRGLAASIQSIAQNKEGDFIVTGKSRPMDYDGNALASWVMKIDGAGNKKWERYFRGDYSYEAPDLIVYEDGRSSVLFFAVGSNRDQRSHARVITFSAQGSVELLEDFSQGQNSNAQKMVAGADGERILVGYAQTSFGDKQQGNEATDAPEYTYDAWVLAAPPLSAYKDPCISAPAMSPLLP